MAQQSHEAIDGHGGRSRLGTRGLRKGVASLRIGIARTLGIPVHAPDGQAQGASDGARDGHDNGVADGQINGKQYGLAMGPGMGITTGKRMGKPTDEATGPQKGNKVGPRMRLSMVQSPTMLSAIASFHARRASGRRLRPKN